jgi:hypothetical protein
MEVENLLLAALLIAGGARVEQVTDDGRVSRIRLSTSGLDAERLKRDFEHFAAAMVEAGSDRDTWQSAYDFGVLGRVETEYRRLKAHVVSRRKR